MSSRKTPLDMLLISREAQDSARFCFLRLGTHDPRDPHGPTAA